jgi:UDP-N-acetylglucosamine 2-epimerase (non-hydrolysing)
MIVFVYGTSAEAIKIAPLARRLNDLGVEYEQWLTLQHGRALVDVSKRLGFRGSVIELPNGNRGESLKNIGSAVKWLFAVMVWFLTHRRTLAKRLSKRSLIIVHGDTMTTVVGTAFAKLLGLSSAHVEAGLRSGDWRNPFPEELDRIAAGKLATIHYAPTEEAVSNLRDRENVVFTFGNTVIDAIHDSPIKFTNSAGEYGVCLLHRFELLSNLELVRETIECIAKNAKFPVRLFLDQFSSNTLNQFLIDDVRKTVRGEFKLPYAEFIDVLRGASFVITDSGGIQAECAQLGIPTLIHRNATEQWEGIGENLRLSHLDLGAVQEFMGNYAGMRRKPKPLSISPTQVIIDDLRTRGYLSEVAS